MKTQSERREFRLSPEDVDRLNELTVALGLSKSEVIREAIQEKHERAVMGLHYPCDEPIQVPFLLDPKAVAELHERET